MTGRHGPLRRRPVMITVVMPVHNGMPWLRDQLAALVAQEYDDEWEVIVADNGSTDGTQDLLTDLAGRHERIRWIDASAVAGASAARNAAVRTARGELMAFCDADDVVHPGWLTACARTLESVDIMAGVFDFWTLNGLPESPPTAASMREFPFLPAGLGANLAVRLQAFEAVGGFAEDLLTGEDIDLCWRLQLEGYRFAIAPDAVVSKRDRTGFRGMFQQASAFGRSGPVLYRRYRKHGARRNLSGAARSWLWILVQLPGLMAPGRRRIQWARAAGMRTGRVAGSISERVFFP